MNVLRRVFIVWAVFIVWLPSNTSAQEPTSTVTGTVVDSRNQPVSGVLVFMDVGPGSATTGAVGAFRLEGVTAGTHALSLRKAGFAPRTFNLVLEPNADRRDVGVIMLEEGPDPTATLRGGITDGTTGQPLADAVIEVNGEVVALTDDNGEFIASDVPIAWGGNGLQVGRISFDAVASEFWVAIPDQTFDFAVTLHPIPIELGRVVAGADRAPFVSARLEPFYERRERGRGMFVTGSEIVDRDLPQVTDAMRGLPGVRIVQGYYGPVIKLTRSTGFDTCASPMIYLDGIYLGGGRDYVNINDIVGPEQVEGIEVYGGAARVPVEFNRTGSGCGVVGIWTR